MVYTPDSEESRFLEGYVDPEDMEEEEIASSANASYADGFNAGIQLAAGWRPYDSSLSSQVIGYFSDVLPKLGNVNYVMFRSGQYTYRMVYSDDMDYDSGYFSSADGQYISYDTRNYAWSYGSEGRFTLDAGYNLVYSDLGDYPVLASDAPYLYLVALIGCIWLLFSILKALFSPARMHWG